MGVSAGWANSIPSIRAYLPHRVEVQDARVYSLPRILLFCGGGRGWSPRAQCSAGTHQALCLASRPSLSLSLCPYQDLRQAQVPGLIHSITVFTDTMLSSESWHRFGDRHFHGKGSELNPLLILSETPAKLTLYVRGKRAHRAESRN